MFFFSHCSRSFFLIPFYCACGGLLRTLLNPLYPPIPLQKDIHKPILHEPASLDNAPAHPLFPRNPVNVEPREAILSADSTNTLPPALNEDGQVSRQNGISFLLNPVS